MLLRKRHGLRSRLRSGMNMSSNHLICPKNWCLISISISSPLPLSHAHTYPPPPPNSLSSQPPSIPKTEGQKHDKSTDSSRRDKKKKPHRYAHLDNPPTVSIHSQHPRKKTPPKLRKKNQQHGRSKNLEGPAHLEIFFLRQNKQQEQTQVFPQLIMRQLRRKNGMQRL